MATEKIIKITAEVDAAQLEELGIKIQGVEESADSASDSVSQMGDEAKGAGEGAKEMGDSTEQASQQTDLLAGAVSTLAAVGIVQFFQEAAESAARFEQSMTTLEISANEAGVSLSDSKKTASALSSEFGISGSTVRRFVSDLQLLGVTNQDTIKGLQQSFTGLAYLMGDSTENVNQKFTKMISTGKIMERSFGTSWGIIKQSIESTGQSVDEWKEKFQNATEPERAEMLNEALSKSKSIQDRATASAGSLEAKMTRLDNAIGGIVRRLGEPILAAVMPLLEGIAFAVGKLVDAWDNLPQPIKDFISGIIIIIGVVGGFIAIMAAVASVLPAISGALIAMAGILGITLPASATAAGAGVMAALSPILLALAPFIAIALAIIGIIIAIQELGKYMGWWTDWGTMIEAFQAGINRLWSAFTNNEQVKAVIQWLKDAWQSVLNFLQPVFDTIGGFFSDMFPSDGGEFDIVRAIIDVLGMLGEVVGTVVGAVIIPYLQTLWDFWSAVFGFIFPFVFAYLQTLWTVWTTIFGFIFNFVIAYLQTLWTFWTTVFNAIMNIIRAAIGVWNSFKTGVSTVVNAVKGFINGLVQSFQSMKDKVMGYLQPIIDGIKWITGNQDNVKAAGGDFGGGFAFTKYDLNGANAVGSGDTYITNIKQQGIIDKYATDLINDTRNNANHLNKQRGG